MIERNVGAMVVGGVVVIAAGIASCTFPTYNITVASGSGGGASTTAASSGSTGGDDTSTTTTSGGGGGSAASSGSAGGGTSSTSSSTGSGACTTDADIDMAISWQCAGGKDCADQDDRAHPAADYTPGAAILGPRSPGTLAYDFDCDTFETKKVKKLICPAVCALPGTELGFLEEVDCGASGTLGHCEGTVNCKWVSNSMNTQQTCK